MRRTHFAAAWVVIGCSAPAARAPAPPPPSPPPDAMAIAIPDAAPPIDAGVIADARRPEPVTDDDSCAKFDPEHPVYCNPPPWISGHIISVAVTGNGTAIEMNRGTEDGVRVGESGELLDDRDKPLSHGHFEVQRVTEHSCRATVALTPDQVNRVVTVRFDP